MCLGGVKKKNPIRIGFLIHDFIQFHVSYIQPAPQEYGLDLSQYLGHILVETVKPFFLLLILQIPVGLDSESSYGFDFGYKILQCS